MQTVGVSIPGPADNDSIRLPSQALEDFRALVVEVDSRIDHLFDIRPKQPIKVWRYDLAHYSNLYTSCRASPLQQSGRA
jgi:hypothetical protein